YRPNFHYGKQIYTDLLRTCRRIYLETSLLPVSENDHVFWTHYAPEHVQDPADPDRYFARMTAEQRRAVCSIQIFASQSWLEDGQSDSGLSKFITTLSTQAI